MGWNMEENGQVEFTDSGERARLDSDPMYALEKGKKDKNILTDRKPALGKLQLENAIRHGDNFELNRQLRAGLRHAKARDGTATMEEKHMAKVLASTHVRQAAVIKSEKLTGIKRTLSRSKLGIQSTKTSKKL